MESAVLLPAQLSVNLLGKAVEDHPSAWALITHMQDLEEAAGPWTQRGPALVILVICVVSQWVEARGLLFFFKDLLIFISQSGTYIYREREKRRDRNIVC